MLELCHAIGALIGLDTADQQHAPALLDFGKTAWLSLLLLAIRLACERVFIPLLRRVLRPDLRKKAADIFDDAFIATFAGGLEVHAIYAILFFNFGCQPWSTDACLVGWPQHSVNIVQRCVVGWGVTRGGSAGADAGAHRVLGVTWGRT